MKFTLAILALCALCVSARAQTFDPYSQTTLLQLLDAAATNTTTAAVGVTNTAPADLAGYAGIGTLTICIVSNYAAAAATCAVWLETTQTAPTNVAGSLWALNALGAASTSASQIVTNFFTGTLMFATNTVFTPATAFTSNVAITNAGSTCVEFGLPVSAMNRYWRLNYNTTGLGASYGVTAILRVRKSQNN